MDIGLNDALLIFGSLAPQLNYTAIGENRLTIAQCFNFTGRYQNQTKEIIDP